MDVDITMQLTVVANDQLYGNVGIEAPEIARGRRVSFTVKVDEVSVGACFTFFHPVSFCLAGEFQDPMVCQSEADIVESLNLQCPVLSVAFRAAQCAVEHLVNLRVEAMPATSPCVSMENRIVLELPLPVIQKIFRDSFRELAGSQLQLPGEFTGQFPKRNSQPRPLSLKPRRSSHSS